MKTDAKIDMLHQSGMFNSPMKSSRNVYASHEEDLSEEEDDVENSLVSVTSDEHFIFAELFFVFLDTIRRG